ncbi:MAG: ComF family protein [Alphaproteobacteria bacterium]|nr:ComF family protein [Alphaproteobacteria bacterium]
MEATALATTAARAALDLVLPPRCLGCGDRVASQGELCARCWTGLRWIEEPCCACCGRPFEHEIEPGAQCGACMAEPPSYDRARAAFAYDPQSRGLVLGFKHGDRLETAEFLAGTLARAGRRLLVEADTIAPVPLHRLRLWWRTYNQAAVLSAMLARRFAKPHAAQAIRRRRHTRSQGRLSSAERRANLRGAFVVPERARQELRGRRVLLIDDVMTTGATVEACAKALLGAGAGAVDVLTAARVLRADSPSL